jgi:sensor histidine kinase regulating citrate/malate metabolism
VDLINMKCHDLKYQLRRLEEEPEGRHPAIFEEIRQTFDIYNSLVKTENDVLDSIIMNIYPICAKQRVKFTYIVDGASLRCLSASDVASLFGNLLDNALECVIGEEEGKRIISLNVRREKDMLLIHIHNHCSVSPVFKDGLPVTTKGDDHYHGFGMRSVRYLVEKYRGDMRAIWDADVFSVDILLPMK